jgi:general secretion pathway protein M
MVNYWTNLNDRERRLVIIGGIFLILYVIYNFIYSPLTDTLKSKGEELQDKSSTLAWMQNVSKKPVKKPRQAITNNKLLTIIATQLKNKSFEGFPYQLEQTNQKDIQLSFDKVPYKVVLTWLWNLKNQYAISLKQFSANKTPTAGVIKVTIIIGENNITT